ncbi:MAG TPA: DNA polymerase III subunit delta', partial [Thermodesulfobacteriota bacterium]|nr:DNA polymerase III subunit delta' [Thermodesulfobacteriota bacterium]
PIILLQRAMKNEKVVNSYLFLGNEGIGKKYVALQFAKALNCLGKESDGGDACDHCSSCKKIDHALHPDVLVIEPEGQYIKVDQVRQMQRQLAYKPYEGKHRVCILTAADRMAPYIPNTLLKTLEEPPLHTVIILLANSSRFILPTILSRCQTIRFNPLPIPLLSKWLMEGKGFNEAEAHLLASLSEGSPGKALEIQEEIHQIPREELLIDWIGLKSLPIERMWNWVESLPSQRENLLLMLEVAKTLLRDLVVVKTLKKEPNLIHSDLLPVMEPMAAKWSLSSLLKRMEILHQTTLAIRSNANTNLALEAMMLSWAEG